MTTKDIQFVCKRLAKTFLQARSEGYTFTQTKKF